MTFDQAVEIVRKYPSEGAKIADYFKDLKLVQDEKESIIADLNSKTIKELSRFKTYSNDKKSTIVKHAYDALIQSFKIGDKSFSYSPFEGQSYEGELLKALNTTTQQDLDTAYLKEKAAIEAREKALNDPQTREEFVKFIQVKGYNALTSEQKATYDLILVERDKEQFIKDKERKSAVQAVQVDGLTFDLKQTVHSKKGTDLFVAVPNMRVEKDQYKQLVSRAKSLGGYYSSFRGAGAIPGFQFFSEDARAQFIASETITKDVVGQLETKKQTASEKLIAMAESLEQKAKEKFDQDRKENTGRRARMAAGVRADAQAEIYAAKVIRTIAEKNKDGSLVVLDRITTGIQIRELIAIYRQNKYAAQRKKYEEDKEAYRRIETRDIEVTIDEILEEVKRPGYNFEPVFHVDNITSLLSKASLQKGIKQDSKRWAKHLLEFRDEKYKHLRAIRSYKLDDFRAYVNRVNPINGISSWDIERTKNQLMTWKRFDDMGINSIPIFRAALRELHSVMNQTKALTPEQEQKAKLKELEAQFINKNDKGFFPTPTKLARSIVAKAKIEEGNTILEPSAGMGHMADVIAAEYPDNDLDVVEWWQSLREFLEFKGHNVIGSDVFEISGQYDRIIMNPPFEKDQDIDHVLHCFNNLLAPGGRLVAIMAPKRGFTIKKRQEFTDFVDEFGHMEDNEPGAFKSAFRSTGVNTITIVLDKPQVLNATESNNDQISKPAPAVKSIEETKPVSETQSNKPEVEKNQSRQESRQESRQVDAIGNEETKPISEPEANKEEEKPKAMKNVFKEGAIVIDPKLGRSTITKVITPSTGYVEITSDNGTTAKRLKKVANLTFEDGTPCFKGKSPEKKTKRQKDQESLNAYVKLSNQKKIESSLKSINGLVYGDRNSLSYQLWEEYMLGIQFKAKELKDEKIISILEKANKYMKISDAQAYVASVFADKNGLVENDQYKLVETKPMEAKKETKPAAEEVKQIELKFEPATKLDLKNVKAQLVSLEEKAKKEATGKQFNNQQRKKAGQLIKTIVDEETKGKKELSTAAVIAIGRKINMNRSLHAVLQDLGADHAKRMAPTEQNLKVWAKNPGKSDLIGVDNKKKHDSTLKRDKGWDPISYIFG